MVIKSQLLQSLTFGALGSKNNFHSTRIRAIGNTASTPCKGSRITPDRRCEEQIKTFQLLSNSPSSPPDHDLQFLFNFSNLVQPCWPATFQHWQTHWAYPTTGGYQSCSILSCRITCLQFGKSVALQAWITTGRSSIGLPRSHHHRREPCSSSINEAFPPSFEQQKLKINNQHQQTASFGLFGWPCWLCRYTDHISKTVSLCSHWPTTRHKLSSCHKCSLAQSCQYHLQKAIAGARKHENPCNHIYLVTYMLNQR